MLRFRHDCVLCLYLLDQPRKTDSEESFIRIITAVDDSKLSAFSGMTDELLISDPTI